MKHWLKKTLVGIAGAGILLGGLSAGWAAATIIYVRQGQLAPAV